MYISLGLRVLNVIVCSWLCVSHITWCRYLESVRFCVVAPPRIEIIREVVGREEDEEGRETAEDEKVRHRQTLAVVNMKWSMTARSEN